MPHTNGEWIVAYRQSGGIVLYDAATLTPRLVSETGGPGAVASGFIAAQGVGIPDGLGGGVWLIAIQDGQLEQVSEEGDSPRLSRGQVFWQQLSQDGLEIRMRPVAGGDVSTLASNATHPSVDGSILAWHEWGPTSRLWSMDLD